jgi:hypothetical protein
VSVLELVVGSAIFLWLFRRLAGTCATIAPALRRRSYTALFVFFFGIFAAGQASLLVVVPRLHRLAPKSLELTEAAALDDASSKKLIVQARGFVTACRYELIRRSEYFSRRPGPERSRPQRADVARSLAEPDRAGEVRVLSLFEAHGCVDAGILIVPNMGPGPARRGPALFLDQIVGFSQNSFIAAYPVSAGRALLSLDYRALRPGEYIFHIWTADLAADASIAFRVEKTALIDLFDRWFYERRRRAGQGS